MGFPETKYYSVKKLAERWNFEIEDILLYGEEKKIILLCCADISGYIPIEPADLVTLSAHLTRHVRLSSTIEKYPHEFISHINDFITIDEIRIAYSDIEAIENSQQSNITESKHTSELLVYLNQLINEFWIDYDQDNPPKNIAMTTWLAEKDSRFCTKDTKEPNALSKYMARITRPDNKK